jgi:hypothetical protein
MRLAAVCLVLAACKPSPAPKSAAVVGTLLVSSAEIASRPELATTAEDVRIILRDQLLATRRFDVRDGAHGRVALSVERAQLGAAPAPVIDPAKPAPDREMAEVVVLLELTRQEGGQDVTLRAEGLSRRPLEQGQSLDPEARRSAFAAALGTAIHEAAEALGDQLDAHGKTDEALIADLASSDARTRDYAIRVLAERRNPAAVPKLIERLSDPDPTVWLRAVGALTAIGDRRAVGPLIEATRKRRPEETGSVLYALATLGGPDAEAYLFTLESGAPDEQVRRAAREAYAELLRNKRSEAGAKNP